MSINNLIQELKTNNEDYEFYPTTKEMLNVIYPHINRETVLDIGCGTCNFKKYFWEYAQQQADMYNKEKELKKAECERNGQRYYYDEARAKDYYSISKYYVMEKSKILLNELDADTICLGTDFNNQTLIDKKVDVIFCNPPYSEFTEWVHKIISEGNYKRAYLIIPTRWKDNQETIKLLEYHKTSYKILGTFDFSDAERQARATVNVVEFKKDKYEGRYYHDQEVIDSDAFNAFFNKTFNIKNNIDDENLSEWEKERKDKDTIKDKLKHALAECKEGKAEILVKLYQEEMDTLIKHLNLIMELDESILETFGFSVAKVKEALKKKLIDLKRYYWRQVLDEMEEITDRLTSQSRNDLFNTFEELQTLDFTIDNIYYLVIWVIKNANKYYNSQLIDFFVKLSDADNVQPYKSNQKLFNRDEWRWNRAKNSHYILDYRIIMSSPFRITWSGKLEANEYNGGRTLNDIKTIANNLGFETSDWNNYPSDFGEKTYIYFNRGTDAFMEYKTYKNGNMHIKFNKEFTKAMNVEVSRLLGWIRCKEDIAREFPDELAKGAEKYFKINNYISLENNNLLLLENKAA